MNADTRCRAIVERFEAEFDRIAKLKRPEREQHKMPMLTVFMFLRELKAALGIKSTEAS